MHIMVEEVIHNLNPRSLDLCHGTLRTGTVSTLSNEWWHCNRLFPKKVLKRRAAHLTFSTSAWNERMLPHFQHYFDLKKILFAYPDCFQASFDALKKVGSFQVIVQLDDYRGCLHAREGCKAEIVAGRDAVSTDWMSVLFSDTWLSDISWNRTKRCTQRLCFSSVAATPDMQELVVTKLLQMTEAL